MSKIISALLIGAIFGLGIALSGMANPAKVINFFDLAGTFDASLIFVMAGALAVAVPGYALIFRARQTPVLDGRFHLPASRSIDAKLIGGSAAFGIGWGIAGFCPGGAIPAIGLGETGTLVFLAAMVAGMILARAVLVSRLAQPATRNT